MSALSELLDSGKFAVTGEIGPPKGVDLTEMFKDVEYLRGRVAAINVTDIQSSVMRVGSLAICKLLKEKGLEPVLQMVCRDRNRLALQSDLLSAAVFGIENVLCLTGDHNILGDHPESKPVFDLDSVQLLKAASTLMEGKDLAGIELEGKPHFCLGAVVNPGSDPLEPQLIKMKKKTEAGARFFQTQAVYDTEVFKRFMDGASKLGIPVLLGIVLLKSAGMAKYMNENVAGVNVPERLMERMKAASKEDRPKVSIEIGAELINGLRDICQGVHIMPLGWDRHVPALIEAAGI